ncbi:unnamed protein product [Candida verbasci]|uniref:Uncharacterized protein n=1 Tax=Candida verbasci TaxID=1227364 RepID=A0A9W4TVY2_9ASCO|nr:unnamed protein product [Candida verbasci]
MQPYSRNGGTRKCFYEFQLLTACFTSSDTSSKKQCVPAYEDYNECLHGNKEREKVRTMLQQLQKNKESKDGGVTAEELYKKSNKIYENLDLLNKN